MDDTLEQSTVLAGYKHPDLSLCLQVATADVDVEEKVTEGGLNSTEK